MAQLPTPPIEPTAYPPQPAAQRPRYRPPIGMPLSRQRRLGSFLLAVALHLLVILLLVIPFTSPELMNEVLGAGGAGPAGGGGGGRGGTGGVARTERLEYVRIAPPPPPPQVARPQLDPVIPPPPVPPKPEPKPEAVPDPAAKDATTAAATEATSVTPGSGGGSGSDGSAGSGPGSGGGVGTGIGTGRGSSVGPGTGGGPGTVYPPSPTELFLPPMPTPGRVKGTEIVVQFDVDSTGRVLDFEFTPTKDGNYNRKLREALAAIRFRPAVDATGVPVRAKAVLTYTI